MDELKSTVTEVLNKRGVLGKFKAQLRKTIISVLNENDHIYMENKKVQEIQETEEGKLLADLIREFLEFYELEYTSSVFIPEANLPQTSSSREQLHEKLHLNAEHDKSKPILHHLLAIALNSASSSSSSSASSYSASGSVTKNDDLASSSEQEPASEPKLSSDSLFTRRTSDSPSKDANKKQLQEDKKPVKGADMEEVDKVEETEQYLEEDFEPESDEDQPTGHHKTKPGGSKVSSYDSPTSEKRIQKQNSGDGEDAGDDKFGDNVSFSDVTATQSDVGDLREKYSYVEDVNPQSDGEKDEEDEYEFNKITFTTPSLKVEQEEDDDDHF